MKEIFLKRPFKTRNADEYNLSDILSLFINPLNGLSSPIEFENSIVKGKMGSGKTMYLRANYAYHLFKIVPSLMENEELILPVFIKLSDFQHIKDASEIYRELILKIIEELSSVYLRLQDAKTMANIHYGMKRIKDDLYFEEKIKATSEQLLKLGSDEYIKKVNIEFGLTGKISYKFIEAASNFKKNEVIEIKQKKNPGIKDIVLAYETLLKDTEGKILLLIDEAGALDRNFFKSDTGDSFFEILMNQIRTSDFIRCKIAVYPNSYSDILTETRYGDIVALEESIDTQETYNVYRKKVIGIIEKYINVEFDVPKYNVYDLFECDESGSGDALEELINGSGGNYRRMIQLLDTAMDEAYKSGEGKRRISKEDATSALKRHCEGQLRTYSELEREYLFNIAKACRTRGSYRFKFAYNAQSLYKYLTKSQEFNLIKVIDTGSGRKSTTYAFDYSYCVHTDIPTHYVVGSEKIDKARSYKEGQWITRVTNITNDIIAQTENVNKLEGSVTYFTKNSGYVKDESGIEYFFTTEYIIQSDKGKSIYVNKRVRFNPMPLGETLFAVDIEVI